MVVVIFEVSGVVIVGGDVIEIICSGIVDLFGVFVDLCDFMNIMLLVLLVVVFWLLFVNCMGYLVLIIYLIIGGIVGVVIVLGMVSG